MTNPQLSSETIHRPGKFEGEPEWAVEYWDAILSGDYTEYLDVHNIFVIMLDDEDYARVSDFEGSIALLMWEDDNGFIHHRLTNEEVKD
jgi:hypothetical protein